LVREPDRASDGIAVVPEGSPAVASNGTFSPIHGLPLVRSPAKAARDGSEMDAGWSALASNFTFSPIPW
jgi:hypothetical protein